MSKIVGIDLGTTNSLVATVDSGIPYVIADAEGGGSRHRWCIGRPRRHAPLVGHAAANRVRVLKPAETVYSAKRFVGRRATELVRRGENVLRTHVNADGSGAVTIPMHGREFHSGGGFCRGAERS
jgi:molecular chaperone DnaK